MSYNKTMQGVRYLVQNELDMACELYGKRFNSGHEAYAVIREEYDELKWETDNIGTIAGYMWSDIKGDDHYDDRLCEIEKHATMAACEAIQVAAMARKAMR